jgi:hypothetical protein
MRRFRGTVSRARAPLTGLVRQPRLLLAAKAALAVAIAWLIAPLVPGVAEEYPYYAPLGALVSMSPTLMSSLRKGVQTLAALAIGILLAGAVIVLWQPNVITIALVVGVGVLVAGNSRLSEGGDYVAVAALFVLIIGGPDADDYSVGYLVQMSVGIAVGLVVNLTILPPLTIGTAVQQLGQFRELLATHLEEMALALTESWPPRHEDWAGRSDVLRETADAVRAAMLQADESRRVNPRARMHHHDLDRDYDDLGDLETITFHVRDLTQVLAAAIWQERGFDAELPHDLREPLADTLHALSAVLVARSAGDDIAVAVDAADSALDDAIARLDAQHDSAHSSLGTAAAVALNARRILAIMRSSAGDAAAR